MEKPPYQLACHAELKGWLLDWIGKSQGNMVAWMLMLVYNLWLARNEARDLRHIEDPKAIVKKTLAGVDEWLNTHKSASLVPTRAPERWLPPEQNWCKVNVDGAFRPSENIGGGGVVLRDHHGCFVAGACHFFSHTVDAEGAELLACRRGLLLASEVQVQHIILETDSVEVAAKLNKEGQDRSVYGPLVDEIKTLLQGFAGSSVRAVRRTANEAAHRIAKEGCEKKLCKVWFDVVPDCIANRLVLDSPM